MELGKLNILGAAYGLKDVTDIVSAAVNTSTNPQTLSVDATDTVFTDGWPGNPSKTLTVVYNYDGGESETICVTEGQTLQVVAPTASVKATLPQTTTQDLVLYGCSFGTKDVTSIVQSFITSGQQLQFTANVDTFGDPNPNVLKGFVMVGSYGGMPIVSTWQENSSIDLTPQNISAVKVIEWNKYAFCLDTQGNLWNMNTIPWQSVTQGFSSVCFQSDADLSVWFIPTGYDIIGRMSYFGGPTSTTKGKAQEVFAGHDGDAWAIKEDGTLIRWDEPNTAWTQQEGTLKTIAVVSRNLQWGLDNNNNILQRTVDSESWNIIANGPGTSPISFITASVDGTLYVVDQDGAAFRYTGGENPWMPFGDPSYPIQSMCIPTIDRGWIVGQDGSVLFIGEVDPDGVSDTLSRKSTVQWDTESVYDETQSTHLYIVNRGAQLAGTDPQLGSFILQVLQPMASPPDAQLFRQALCQGLYDADFKAPYNNPNFIGQPTWASHFYDDSTGLNYEGDSSPTALTNGVKFFQASVNAMKQANPDIKTAGYNLGLCLHYFTDLTQPMHAGNYTYLSSFPLGYHTDFEQFMMAKQAALVPQPVITGFVPSGVTDPGAMFKTLSAYSKGTYLNNVVGAKNYLSWKWSPSQWQNKVLAFLPSVLNDAVASTAQLIYLWAHFVKQQSRPEGIKTSELSMTAEVQIQ
jgi:phospholipase C